MEFISQTFYLRTYNGKFTVAKVKFLFNLLLSKLLLLKLLAGLFELLLFEKGVFEMAALLSRTDIEGNETGDSFSNLND